MQPQILELEITNRCPLACPIHCYAESSPTGSHGTMTISDWRMVITDAAALGARHVQLIGGEPTAHPGFVGLLRHALDVGLKVEVYSNLFHVREPWWDVLSLPGVSIATSYYSDISAEHDAITGRTGSHARTRAHIAEALSRGIPLRAGIVHVLDRQHVEQAQGELERLGVRSIRTDRIRRVGRAARTVSDWVVSELCGWCGRGRAAISPSGEVWPCVMARWMRAGNVKEASLAEILSGSVMADLVSTIPEPGRLACNPECNPKDDGDDCAPAETPACNPKH